MQYWPEFRPETLWEAESMDLAELQAQLRDLKDNIDNLSWRNYQEDLVDTTLDLIERAMSWELNAEDELEELLYKMSRLWPHDLIEFVGILREELRKMRRPEYEDKLNMMLDDMQLI